MNRLLDIFASFSTTREVAKAKQKAYDELYARISECEKMPEESKSVLVPILKNKDSQKELHCIFVDLEKAYDRVQREELRPCMRMSGVAEKYTRVVQDQTEEFKVVVVESLLICYGDGQKDVGDGAARQEVKRKAKDEIYGCDERVHKGHAYQYKFLPFGFALSPRTFTKVARAMLAPLHPGLPRRLASYNLVQGPFVSEGQLGKEPPYSGESYLFSRDGVELREHAGAIIGRTRQGLADRPFRGVFSTSGQTEIISEAPGAYGSRSPSHSTRAPAYATTAAMASLASSKLGMASGSSTRVVVTTDASKTGWGAVCGSHRESGSWIGRVSRWHINCLELVAVTLVLRRFCPLLRGRHVLVKTDSTAVVAMVVEARPLGLTCMAYLSTVDPP
ncbi:hypothetical protein DNTS_029829, partial [Danionella cerebrum]